MSEIRVKPFSHHNTDISTGEMIINSVEVIFTDPFDEDNPSGIYEFQNFLSSAYVERTDIEDLVYIKFLYCHFRNPLTDKIEIISVLFDDKDLAFKTVASLNYKLGIHE